MKLTPNGLQSPRRIAAPPQVIKTPATQKHVAVSETSAAFGDTPSEETGSALTPEQLISRAKHHIGVGETSRISSFRAAAQDIALACDQGAKQREVAKGLGKSVAWVNRLLKWHEGGGVGAPFADKVVQGVNKVETPPKPAPTIPPSNVRTPSATTSAVAPNSEGECLAAPAIASVTKIPAVAYGSNDSRLPVGRNWLDPERAFQRLTEEWSSSSFRDLLLDSPKAVQERFLRDVLLTDLGGAKTIILTPADEEGGR